MAAFSKGDLVRLKSGGPSMTVDLTDSPEPGFVVCSWFDKNQKRQTDEFPADSLEIARRSKAGPAVSYVRFVRD
jgi:uncharacterized protein YodC (DUF2158 family)